MRLFVGLPIPGALAQGLARTARSLELVNARWTPPENLHLTLLFLGQVGEETVPAILRELDQLDLAPLELRFTQLGLFPKAGVLFAEIEPTLKLVRLHAQVVRGMAHCGFPPEERPYHPHVTVARIRSSTPLRNLRTVLPTLLQQRFTVDAVNIYRSYTLATGVQYEVLATKRAGH